MDPDPPPGPRDVLAPRPEPPDVEVPEGTPDFGRLYASLPDEAEAIGWLETHVEMKPDPKRPPPMTCELNLALIPDAQLAGRLISLSTEMGGRYRPLIQLTDVTPRVAFAPHVTVYQVPVRVRDLPAIRAALNDVAGGVTRPTLRATEYGSNEGEGSFEVRYEAAAWLMELQAKTIAVVNPRRGDLMLERDPAGRPLTERVTESGLAGDNIRRTGFDAVGNPAHGGLFQPHITINWFEPNTSIELDDLQVRSLARFDGHFVALGMFVLGPYGTCAQRLATLSFHA